MAINPEIKLAGVIHSAPFFKMSKHVEYNWFNQTKAKVISMLGEEALVNAKLQI